MRRGPGVPARVERGVAVGLAACSLLFLALALVAVPATTETPIEIALAFAAFAAAFVVVGALVVARQPGNTVGRLMLGIGVSLSVPVLAGQYAGHVLFGSGDGLPAPLTMAWVTSWLYILAMGGIIQLLLVFPDGRYGRRRRWVALFAGTATVLLTAAQMVLPGEMDGFPGVANPWGIESAGAELRAVVGVTSAAYGLSFVLAVGLLLLRLRRARGTERQQLKWFAAAATFFLLALLANELTGLGDGTWLGLLLVVLGLLFLPSAIGLAVLRYRLYDVDLVINRALVYGSVTALLVGVYLGTVLVLRAVLDPLVGESQLAVAGSTLAVAALVRPVRARVQSVVDHRFYRRRYDARVTLAEFSGRLRDELDLETLGVDLRRVVQDTMAPAHVSLWLRSEP